MDKEVRYLVQWFDDDLDDWRKIVYTDDHNEAAMSVEDVRRRGFTARVIEEVVCKQVLAL